MIKKTRIYQITHRLYKELEENSSDIVLRKMRNLRGLYDYSTDAIELDYRKELLPTLIHEYMHKWYPKKSETWVLQQESLITNSLSDIQVRRILFKFSQSLLKP